MKFSHAIDSYLADMRAGGRINSDRSEESYYVILALHGEDVGGRDPRTTNREDVKRTLGRWPNPNTQRTRRAILVSFYDWAMEEGHRKDNPARQTRRPKARPTAVYRLQHGEARALMLACEDGLERRAIYLGLCAGLRSAELLGLQARNFSREGYVWVSPDIAKGGRERYVPVICDLEDVVAEIRAHVGEGEYVLCGQQFGLQGQPPIPVRVQFPERPMASTTLGSLVARVAARAGIAGNVGPHTLRHAFCDHVARSTGDLRLAQSLMGHANVATTRGYTGAATLDELTSGVADVSYLREEYPPREVPETPAVEPARAEQALSQQRPSAPPRREQNPPLKETPDA